MSGNDKSNTQWQYYQTIDPPLGQRLQLVASAKAHPIGSFIIKQYAKGTGTLID